MQTLYTQRDAAIALRCSERTLERFGLLVGVPATSKPLAVFFTGRVILMRGLPHGQCAALVNRLVRGGLRHDRNERQCPRVRRPNHDCV